MPIYNGTPGNDSLLGSFGDDQLYGGAGDDTLDGSWGKDTLDGGDGIDTATYAFYDRGINVDLTTGVLGFPDYPGYFETLRNIENLIGSQGNDTLKGNAVNNLLNGGLGNDELYGDAGNDSLNGGEGNDSLRGGDGDDLLFGDNPPFAQGLNLGDDTMFGGSGNDLMVGWGGNDLMEGDNGDDALYGMDGNDTVLGGNGRDVVDGGAGNDVLFGGNNDDILSGSSVWGTSSVFEQDVLIAGGGADTFVLAEDTGADIIGVGRVVATYYLGDSYAVIADFNASEGDKIKLAGSMGDYSFKPTNVLGDSFPNLGIFKDDDLIAAVYNVTSLSESNFVFV